MKDNKNQSKILNNKINDFKTQLTDAIKECNAVYITSHKDPDFDAIASMGAMGLICKRLKKSPYLVIDEEDYKNLKQREHDMFDKIKDKFVLINMDDYNNNKLENSLLIVVDVNKTFRTPFKNNYKDFKNVVIIDHHKPDEDTINSKIKLIMEDSSSCSELLYWLLKKYHVTPSVSDYYKFLLVGIYLDTDKKNKNLFPSTYECMHELSEKLTEEEENEVESYFSHEWEEDMKLNRLKSKAIWKILRYGISIGNDETYTKVDVARLADDLLKYVCEASIVCGKNEKGSYYVSARSNRDNVDIANLMHELGNGGGNMSSAACEVYVDADSNDEEKEILYNKILKLIYHKKSNCDI